MAVRDMQNQDFSKIWRVKDFRRGNITVITVTKILQSGKKISSLWKQGRNPPFDEHSEQLKRKIINTNIRLNLCDKQDRQAWEYLQTMDRQKYKSYTKAVVAALNDYFAREYRNEEDPYLESREKEDAFLERVETAIRDGVKESVPMAMAKNLFEMITPFVKESVGENQAFGRLEEKPEKQDTEDVMDWEQEADMDAALEFADSF